MMDKGTLEQFRIDQRRPRKANRTGDIRCGFIPCVAWAELGSIVVLVGLIAGTLGCATSISPARGTSQKASSDLNQRAAGELSQKGSSGAAHQDARLMSGSALELRGELSSKEVAAGTLVLVTLRLPDKMVLNSDEGFTGEFEEIRFTFFTAADLGPQVYEAVLGVPYERKPGPGEIHIQHFRPLKSAGILADQSRPVEELEKLNIPFQVVDGHYPSETLHVDGRRVNPTQKKDLIRIKKEMAEVSEIYKKVTLHKYWSGPFAYPLRSKVTSAFGSRRIYNGSLKNYHPGLDLKAAMRTPVYSAAPGVVVLAKNLFYTGNTVMIDHGYGVVTLYAHMTVLKVAVGQVVTKHALLGLSGKTGRVSGPHLHWQAVVHHVKVNPIGLTEVMR